MDRRTFIAAAGSAAALQLGGCGGGGGSSAPPPPPPAPPPPPTNADWANLSSQLQGTLLRPDTAAFALAAPVFNAAFDATVPQALVRCASSADVVLVLAFAHDHGLPLTVRSGGHGYTGNSTTTGLVIDTGPLDAISVDTARGTATIGAGAKLVDIYDQLCAQGVCIPSGSCPTIGIAGITQGGGIGLVDRAYGLTCDSLVSAQVVLADRSVVTCDANTHADLFWALRGGGGGNFGVVTQLTFKTFATTDVTTFRAAFAWADAAKVLAAWQAWPQTLPDSVWSGLVLGSTGLPTGMPVIEVSGLALGGVAQFAPIWAQFLAATGATPTAQSTTAQTFRDAMLAGCGGATVSQCHLASETADGQVQRTAFVASSDFFNATLPSAGVQALVDAMAAQKSDAHVLVIMDLMGGAIARVAPDATAFVHRNAIFSAQYYIAGPVNESSTQLAQAKTIVAGLRTTMAPWSSGEAYQNYLDASLSGWQSAYYGANYARLRQVKTAVDPTRVFRPLQGIEPQ